MPCCGDDSTSNDIEEHEENKKYYGEPKKHDPNFKGPFKKRSCTDLLCLLIFLVCMVAMVAVSIVGFAKGDPIRLIYPTDSFGNVCGYGDYEDKKYLFFFDLLKCADMGTTVINQGCPTPQICVSECPSNYWAYVQTEAVETLAGSQVASERDQMICKYSVDPYSNVKTVRQYVEDDDCAAYYVTSISVINRCLPSIFNDIADMGADLTYSYTSGATTNTYTVTDAEDEGVTGTNLNEGSYFLSLFYEAREFVELIFKDILASWWMILVGAGIALFLCFVWIVLLRFIAGPMVWITIGLVFGLLTFACYYSFNEYNDLKDVNVTQEYGISEDFGNNFSYYLSLKKTWLAFAIILAITIFILLLIFIFLVKRICIAIEIIKEGSRCIGNMFSTLFWPIIPFFLQIIFFAYWATSALYIASMGDSEYYTNATNSSSDGLNYYLSRVPCSPDDSTIGSACDFVKYGGDEYIIPIQLFLVFMLLWGLNFLVAMGQMTLAGAFGSYYWAWEKPKDIPAFPLTASLHRSIRYHTGSLAFGSFIIAVVQAIRAFLEYLEYKLKDSENRVSKFILKCLKCCFWCLEKFLKFLNKNAYIIIAIRGKNFCFSAKDAFMLIMRNIVRVVVLDKVTDFVLFLSKLMVTGIVFMIAFLWFRGGIDYFDDYVTRAELNYYLTPVIILTLWTYLLAAAFFSVYSMAIDTLFLCFLEDLEMNDGSTEKPYFMSKGLMKVLGKKNKKMVDPGSSSPDKVRKKKDQSGESSSKPKKNNSKVDGEDVELKSGARPLPQPKGTG